MKSNLKGAIGIDTCRLASKTDLAILKTKVDNLDIDKLQTVSADLSKLSNVVFNGIVKKTPYDQLVIKVIAIDTKIPGTCGLVT